MAHVVENATKSPNICQVSGRGDLGPYLDLGVATWTDPNIYISHAGFVTICRESGWAVPVEVHDATCGDLRIAYARIEALEAELATAEAVMEAVHTLKQGGFQAARKPGRPPKTAA